MSQVNSMTDDMRAQAAAFAERGRTQEHTPWPEANWPPASEEEQLELELRPTSR